MCHRRHAELDSASIAVSVDWGKWHPFPPTAVTVRPEWQSLVLLAAAGCGLVVLILWYVIMPLIRPVFHGPVAVEIHADHILFAHKNGMIGLPGHAVLAVYGPGELLTEADSGHRYPVSVSWPWVVPVLWVDGAFLGEAYQGTKIPVRLESHIVAARSADDVTAALKAWHADAVQRASN